MARLWDVGTLARKNEMLARVWHVGTPVKKRGRLWHAGTLARKNEMLASFWHVGTHGTRFSKLFKWIVYFTLKTSKPGKQTIAIHILPNIS